MLRTNSKQARENVKNYILVNVREWIEENAAENAAAAAAAADPENFTKAAAFIWDRFMVEKVVNDNRYNMTKYDYFKEWLQGLSCGEVSRYWYRSAVDILGNILEETEAEANKYTESQAEELLTRLIYKEVEAAQIDRLFLKV